jgi:hypothetical protein
VHERRTPPAIAALLNAQQMLDDAKAGILATGWQPGAAHALTLNMLCDDGYTRVLILPEPNEKKLAKFVRGLEDTFINARVTRYLFMMYSDERLMIGAADAMGGMCCGYFDIVHGPAGGAFGDLIGCVACNRWGWPDDKNLIMELPEEDIAALRKRVTPSRRQ